MVFLDGVLLVDFDFFILAVRFAGGFLIVPFSISAIGLGSRIAAFAICSVVEPFFLALDIAALAFVPVPFPATPFFGLLAMILTSGWLHANCNGNLLGCRMVRAQQLPNP